MFREMRRQDRLLTAQDAAEILSDNAYGTLTLTGTNGYPYGVPLHYVVIHDKLYFHGSRIGGLKTECIEKNPRVCFTVIESLGGAKCRSVIIFGYIEQTQAMASEVLNGLIEKFVPQQGWEQAKMQIPMAKDRIAAWQLTVEHISAKVIDKPEGR